MNIVLYILFGALAGWIASLITGDDQSLGVIGNIVVGIIGALLGSWIVSLFGFSGVNGFNVTSLIVAVLGAVVTLSIARMVTGRRALPR
ncbi:MAG: GlsB/YeaQ/YmgE family stress response membrane protein [bacterium]|nr:GlsB/YeaQ/YmgE family stress response membrane protein [bacterium]